MKIKKILSKEEATQISWHLRAALAFIGALGLITSIVGYVFYRPAVVLSGVVILFMAALTFVFLYLRDYFHFLQQLRAPILERTKPVLDALKKAESALKPVRDELKSRSSITLGSQTSDSLNYLSLERLIEALNERMSEILALASSSSEENILHAEELLSKDLVFSKRVSEHLIQHDMPDMPPSTWIDSLNFLSARVTEDINKQKQSMSSLHTIKKYDKED